MVGSILGQINEVDTNHLAARLARINTSRDKCIDRRPGATPSAVDVTDGLHALRVHRLFIYPTIGNTILNIIRSSCRRISIRAVLGLNKLLNKRAIRRVRVQRSSKGLSKRLEVRPACIFHYERGESEPPRKRFFMNKISTPGNRACSRTAKPLIHYSTFAASL